jgi:xanthine dehydrogenase YagR molybdenum-binding subunit
MVACSGDWARRYWKGPIWLANGSWANASLSDYPVAVKADVLKVEVDFDEVHDEIINPLGVKGCGEIGQVGAAAAIADAVFHATGRRVHELPIRIEHLL